MLDDRQSREMLQQARNAVLAAAKADGATPLGAALLDVANRVQPDTFDALLTALLAKRSDLRAVLDGEQGCTAAEALLRRNLALADGLTRDGLRGGLTLNRQRFLEAAEALGKGSDAEIKRGDAIKLCCANQAATLFDLQEILLTKEGEPRKSLATKKTLGNHAWLEDFFKTEQQRLADALGQIGDLECLEATLSLLKLGSAIVSGFEQAKRAKGAYDFDDLIIKTGELLSEKPDAQWVLYKLDGGIDHMLVDEAQDTSPMQWQIVRALTDEFFAGAGRSGPKLRTLFVVGDRKQSIYSFQGADPNVFEIVHDDFKSSARGASQEFRDVDFTVSFRSAPEILQAVDLVFARSSPARIGLDGLMSRDWHHESNRRDSKGTVEIWPLTVPEDKAEQDPWQAPVDREPAHSPRRRLAKHIARTIKGWIGKRQLVSHGRPVAAGDVLILVQRRNSFFDAMIRALWNEQVPVAGADRLKLNENIAVLDLMALAQFALMPEDDHALACVLKSPVLARPLSEEELFEIAAHRGALSLWESLRKKTEQPYAAAASLLERLIAEAPSARPFEFLSGVLARARLRFASRLGSEANDAIDALLDAALDYEEANGTTLAGFVNWFSAGETEIKRNMEQGADEVRIMTVHGAKGLEAPIVILPDTTGVPDQKSDLLLMLEAGNGQAKVPLWPVPKLSASKMVRQFKDQHKDVRTHENQRLLYVAMTRARDELFVCGYAGEKAPADHCWYHTIANALKDKMTPLDGDAGWRMGAAPVPASDAASSSVDGVSLPEWLSVEVAGTSAAIGPVPKPRRSAARVARGILIHKILQQIPDWAETERAEMIAAAVKRAGADAALAQELVALAAHPICTELFSGDGLSEVPLMAQLAGRSPERRRIDRLVVKPDGILVADYKTDREVPRRRSSAIRSIFRRWRPTGRPCASSIRASRCGSACCGRRRPS